MLKNHIGYYSILGVCLRVIYLKKNSIITGGGIGIWAFIDWVIALSKAYGASFKDAKDFTFDASGAYTR